MTKKIKQQTSGKIRWGIIAIFTQMTMFVQGQNIEINSINFPDANFRNYLLSQPYGNDSILTDVEIISVTSINVSNLNISDLTGIEFFIALQELNCANNQITDLDLTSCSALSGLSCAFNQITNINLNSHLAYLDCRHNRLMLSVLYGIQWWGACYLGEQTLETRTIRTKEVIDFSDQTNFGGNPTNFKIEKFDGITYADADETNYTETDGFFAFLEPGNYRIKMTNGAFNSMIYLTEVTATFDVYMSKYTVNFAGEEINIAPQTVEEGGYAIKPTDPERENYTFNGWFTDNDTFSNEWNFATCVVTQDTILYAKWAIITGISEIENSDVKIYPNPTKDELRIETGGLRIKRIKIVDMSGREIYQFKSLRNPINVSALPPGIYFLKFETYKGTVTKKFIKE
jgi:uncharacterized repeat protein (TIGR02543 family)